MDAEEFDIASRAWRANKIALGGGWFAYRCAYIHSDGKECKRAVTGSGPPQVTPSGTLLLSGRQPGRFCKRHKVRGGAFQIHGDSDSI